MTQQLLANLFVVSEQFQEDLFELQQDTPMKALFKIKGTMVWLPEECKKNFHFTTLSRPKLIVFPSSYSVECDFSAIANLLHAKEINWKSSNGWFEAKIDKTGASNQKDM